MATKKKTEAQKAEDETPQDQSAADAENASNEDAELQAANDDQPDGTPQFTPEDEGDDKPVWNEGTHGACPNPDAYKVVQVA